MRKIEERIVATHQKKTPTSEHRWQRLFERVSLIRENTRSHEPPEPIGGYDPRTDFSTLPGYHELRLQRTFAEQAGVEIPYFRLHDGRAGAQTRVHGRNLNNFSSYDYLGLNGEPEVLEAAKRAIDCYGISASASRHVAGERPVHRQLERALADHYGVEECMVLVSGYATNLGVIGQLLGPKDLLAYDTAIHNSALMGGVLSGAARRSFPHNDFDALENMLASLRNRFERVLIVVEGLYSMDGDYPDLQRLIEIKKRYKAWLMVDEAHALGVLGGHGSGSFEHCKISPRDVDIWMGTLSKALAACGGYIAGSAQLVDYLKSTAGVFVYSVAMPPVIAATALKALQILHREPERVGRLQRNAALFHALAKERGLAIATHTATAICPIMIGDSLSAVVLAQELFKRGVNVQPVTYPAVPPKAARLRFFLTAMHDQNGIVSALNTVAEEWQKLPETMQILHRRVAERSAPSAGFGPSEQSSGS